MILSLLEWPLSPLEQVELGLLIFSADLAALITILSKLAEETVRLVDWGVTNIFKIFRLSSSVAVLLFRGDPVIIAPVKNISNKRYNYVLPTT